MTTDLKCSPGWRFDNITRKSHQLNCKRRRCDECGKFWAFKWRSALAEKCQYDLDHDRPTPRRALTLTFACNPGYEVVKSALRYFWQLVRKAYPKVEYFGAVEFNQRHTVPHIHFILSRETYIPQSFLVEKWQTAQRWAGCERIAFNVRIEAIKKNVQAYYTKYISKLTGGKDEIPRKENWGGRFIRYSKHFFPAPIPVMADVARFRRLMEAGEQIPRVGFHVRKPLAGLSGAMEAGFNEFARLDRLVNRPWDYKDDRFKSVPIDISPQLVLPL